MRELSYYLKKRKAQNNDDNSETLIKDDDVRAEHVAVNQMSVAELSQSHFVLKNLKKKYTGAKSTLFPCWAKHFNDNHVAVNSLNLTIKKGECFGLLGVNGAGKTTTFKMITGDISISKGSVIIEGFNVSTQQRYAQRHLGYCPQFDALLEQLTARELLTYYARLRGVPEAKLQEVAEKEIRRLDLVKYANKVCSTYSGGNKRKLSTAVALVGNPPIILLDEPTSGMDPVTRRFLWNVILGIIKEDGIIMLTSHDMEECEALCTRLAIMVNGQFKCLGSIQHLKSKFGLGYTVSLKVDPVEQQTKKARVQRKTIRRLECGSSRITQFKRSISRVFSDQSIKNFYKLPDAHYMVDKALDFFKQHFSDVLPLEKHQDTITFNVPSSENVHVSSIFKAVEEHKDELQIVDYNVSQTSLDQVFVKFAREQEEVKK